MYSGNGQKVVRQCLCFAALLKINIQKHKLVTLVYRARFLRKQSHWRDVQLTAETACGMLTSRQYTCPKVGPIER